MPPRSRTFALASCFACRFQIGEQGANPFPTRAGTGLLDVGETELAGLLADCREHEPGLCPSRGFDLTGAACDREKMI